MLSLVYLLISFAIFVVIGVFIKKRKFKKRTKRIIYITLPFLFLVNIFVGYILFEIAYGQIRLQLFSRRLHSVEIPENVKVLSHSKELIPPSNGSQCYSEVGLVVETKEDENKVWKHFDEEFVRLDIGTLATSKRLKNSDKGVPRYKITATGGLSTLCGDF